MHVVKESQVLTSLRDFLLLVVVTFAIPYLGMRLANSKWRRIPDRSGTLLVDGMCCPAVAKPMVERLKRINGIAGVSPDYRRGSIQLTLDETCVVAGSQIWQAAQTGDIQPLALSIRGKAFIPHRDG